MKFLDYRPSLNVHKDRCNLRRMANRYTAIQESPSIPGLVIPLAIDKRLLLVLNTLLI